MLLSFLLPFYRTSNLQTAEPHADKMYQTLGLRYGMKNPMGILPIRFIKSAKFDSCRR